jgi:hypothetical protein
MSSRAPTRLEVERERGGGRAPGGEVEARLLLVGEARHVGRDAGLLELAHGVDAGSEAVDRPRLAVADLGLGAHP